MIRVVFTIIEKTREEAGEDRAQKDRMIPITPYIAGAVVRRHRFRSSQAGGSRMMMMVVRYLAARVAKIIGNFLKVLCYPPHFLFPKVRFSLPHRSEPILATNSAHRIPKIIWQTNFTDRVTLAVYLNYLFNRCLSPTYAYRFMDSRERARVHQGALFSRRARGLLEIAPSARLKQTFGAFWSCRNSAACTWISTPMRYGRWDSSSSPTAKSSISSTSTT